MNEAPLARILCVDDEPALLDGLSRVLRRSFDVTTAIGPSVGLTAIQEKGPFAVVVADMRMPEMDGAQFLARARELDSAMVRILLTGHAEISAAISAVNTANIFRFLTKPCPPDILIPALTAAEAQHRLITAEKELLERTLRGAVRVLTEILGLVNPSAFSHANRMRSYVDQIARRLDLASPWQFEIAAMLAHLGCVALPADLLDKVAAGVALTPEEQKLYAEHPEVAFKLLTGIPRLETVAAMVLKQRTVVPGPLTGKPLPEQGALLLSAAAALDARLLRGLSVTAAVAEIRKSSPNWDLGLLDALAHVEVHEAEMAVRAVTLGQLSTSMVLADDLHGKNGVMLMAKGQPVTIAVIERLRAFSRGIGVKEPIMVLAPCKSNEATATAK